MAERRMISKSLVMSNKFLQLSNDNKALFLYLIMFADDDGIVERSMMIDAPLQVDDSNYKELERQGLIISYDDQIKVVTDWNRLQSIRKDIYNGTSHIEVRNTLYMKTDYSYTNNASDTGVFASANDWVALGRQKDIKDFEAIKKSLRNRQQQATL